MKSGNMMDRMNNWLESKFMPIAARIASQRYLMAVKNAFFSVLPFTMVGSLFVVLAFLAVPGWDKIVEPFLPTLFAGMTFTNNLLGVWFALAFGYHLADHYGLEPLIGGSASLFGFLITASTVVDGNLTMTNLGGGGIFTAIIIGIFSVETYRLCLKYNIKIRMPDAVPPKISESFGAIVPLLIEAVILLVVVHGFGFDLTVFVMDLFKPLVLAGDSFIAVVVIAFLVALLFYMGIQGWSVVLGVVGPIQLANIQANAAAFAAGERMLPHVLTEPFFAAWGSIGGTTMAGALIICLFLAKSKQLRQSGKLSLIPALVANVNEPAMFSVPTVMNPYLFIPVVFVYPIAAAITWVAMNLGWVMKPYVYVSWAVPMPFYPYLATGGDWRAVVLMLFNLAVGTLIYYPFVKAYDKKLLADEKAVLEASA